MCDCPEMAHRPQFRYLARSLSLWFQPTQLANSVAAANKAKPVTTPAKSPEKVEEQARSTIPARYVMPELILARSELQFGQYRGQTFQWLLENAVSYAVSLIDSVQKEQQPMSDTPLGVNKCKLCVYAMSFADVRQADEQAAEARVAATGDEGECLLGFGQYRNMTWGQVVGSDDRKHRSFVRNFVLKKTDCVPGSWLQQFQAYCRRRLEQPCPPSLPAGYSDSDATDVEDEELLAAVGGIEHGSVLDFANFRILPHSNITALQKFLHYWYIYCVTPQ